MELVNRRKLRISDLIPSDSGVYACEVDVEFDHGIGHAPHDTDVDDLPVVFQSPTAIQSNKPYTLSWRANNDFTSRATDWIVRWRSDGGRWSDAQWRSREQMFYQVPANELEPDTVYDFELTSVRQGNNGRKVFGKKNYHQVKTENRPQTTAPTTQVYTTQKGFQIDAISSSNSLKNSQSEAKHQFENPAQRTTMSLPIVNFGEISVKSFTKAAHLAWPHVPDTSFYEVRLASRRNRPIKTDKPEIKLDSLTPSTRYQIRVKAIRRFGGKLIPIAEGRKDVFTRPLPPRDLTYRVEPDGIRLNWKGPNTTKKYKIIPSRIGYNTDGATQ